MNKRLLVLVIALAVVLAVLLGIVIVLQQSKAETGAGEDVPQSEPQITENKESPENKNTAPQDTNPTDHHADNDTEPLENNNTVTDGTSQTPESTTQNTEPTVKPAETIEDDQEGDWDLPEF